ncbi:response regulator [Persicobacter diffluens]|uniref:Phosphate regulon transcriptional regulatory protein PhoB n=1 Tax=Persicobacter diffluens TaxID=981 RepID=A0AAN5ALV9_9BACT|nr:DNA-binding response regulator [Persicobacter diffluens]
MKENIQHKVLVVDDEEDIRDLLEYNLKASGYQIQTAEDGQEAVAIARSFKPDLILLDIMMPTMDGIEACRQLRNNPEMDNTLIVFLTARAEEYSEVAAFDMGADDYIIKPVKPRALKRRIEALMERSVVKEQGTGDILKFPGIRIDKTSYTVEANGEKFSLPKKEFELLYTLAQTPGKILSRDELLRDIWGTDVYILPRTVDVHVRKVREKIGNDLIVTIKGVGYKFNDNL